MSETIKKVGIIIAVFVVGAVGGIFSTEILWPSVVEAPLFGGYKMPEEKVEISKTEKITVTENEALQDAIQEVESSVVKVQDKKEGTGFVITSDGLIVTLSSIADGTSTVFYNGEKFKAGLVKTGETFTTLKIDKNDLSTQGLADIDEARLGQRVFLVGKLSGTVVNHGIIKHLNEGIHTNIYEVKNLEGSPLLNIEGRVLGLTTINEQGQVVGVPLPEINQLIEE